MKFKDYLNVDMITEMANISSATHGIMNVKMNIRQPGNENYKHDVSVKVFSKSNIDDSMIISINRNTNSLVIQRDIVWMKTKTKTKVLDFIQKNVLNFINLWDDNSLAIDEVVWVK